MIVVKKYAKNPVIVPELKKNKIIEESAYNPGVVVKNKQVFLFYRSEKYGRNPISKINLCTSSDGFNFKKYKTPVIEPDRPEEKSGCEDPRILKIENKYFLTYTSYEGRDKKGNFKINLSGAISENLLSFKKIGTLIPKDKSGAIVKNYKYKNKYVMYFGGEEIKIAFSKDLKNWETAKRPVLSARKGNFFDNYLIEGGPPPIVTKKGIFLIYNAKNHSAKFAVGVAIFDKKNPSKLIKRYEKPIMEPTEYWEKFGRINNVVFVTSLIYFRKKWLLYYGGADKAIGVAEIKF